MLKIKLPGFVLPVLFAVSIAAAFYAGDYVAKSDASKREAERAHSVDAATSADQLKLYASLLAHIRSGQADSAIRVLEFQAHAQTKGAAECLASQICATLAAPTPEKRSQLRELVAAHATWPLASTK